MNDELSEEDKLELERRRSAELVTEAVEAALKRRYTWVGIIVAFAAFLGSTMIIKAVTADLQTQIAVGADTLDRIKSQAVDNETLAETVRRKLATLDAGIEGRLDELDAKIEEKSGDLDALYDARKRSVDNLDRTVLEVQEVRARVDELADLVELLATGHTDGDSTQLEGAVAASIEDLKSGQNEIRKRLDQTAAQIKLSQYSVYVHVAGDQEDDEYLGRDLGTYLNEAGFVVPRVQSVAQKSRSIRYFYEQDRPGALKVQQSVQEFLATQGLDLQIEIRDFTNFSGKKPRTGIIELWLYR